MLWGKVPWITVRVINKSDGLERGGMGGGERSSSTCGKVNRKKKPRIFTFFKNFIYLALISEKEL